MIRYTPFRSPVGKMAVARSAKGVCRICLPSESEETLLAWLKKNFPGEEIEEDSETLAPVVDELNRYLRGSLKTFTFPVDLKTTPFRKRVLEKVGQIPYGKTASYKQISHGVGNPAAVRAVGGANAHNPLPFVIPCHRVIAHDGSLGGYGGGLSLKMKLLQMEGAL